MENTLKDLGQKVEGVENKIPTKNYFSKDYNINLELPISMSSIDRKVKYYDINQAMSDEDRANWFGKIIPLDEQDRILKNYKPSPKEESGVKTFFSEGGKSFWNTALDILTYPYQWGIQKSAGLGVNVAEKVAKINDFPVNENDKEKSVLEVEKELNPNYEDAKFNLKEAEMWSPAWWGQGSGNVTASLVLPIFTGKVPYTALSFGMMTDTDVTRARLEQGDSLLEANAKGSSSGAFISAFELFHINTLTKRVILPRVQRYLARFATGSTVEVAQQGVEDVAMGDADTRTPEQKRGAYISSIVFGGAGDVVGHIARDTATRKIQKEIKKKALKEGYSETLATELAQTSMVDENPDYEKVSQELKKEVNQRQDVRRGEVYEEFIKQGDSPEIASKKANELVPSVEEVESEILDDLKNGKLVKEEDIENLKQAYVEATSVANEDADKYILMKDEIKSLIEKAGKDEQEADDTARIMTSIAINSYQIAKEQGVDIDFDKIKNEVFKLNNIINYAQNEPISEAEQEDIWREVERERVAELQEGIDKYMKASKGELYSRKKPDIELTEDIQNLARELVNEELETSTRGRKQEFDFDEIRENDGWGKVEDGYFNYYHLMDFMYNNDIDFEYDVFNEIPEDKKVVAKENNREVKAVRVEDLPLDYQEMFNNTYQGYAKADEVYVSESGSIIPRDENAYEQSERKVITDELEIYDWEDVNNLRPYIQFRIAEEVLDKLGVEYRTPYATDESSYIVLSDKNDNDIVIRFSDHENISRLHDRPTLNVAPNWHRFEDFLEYVLNNKEEFVAREFFEEEPSHKLYSVKEDEDGKLYQKACHGGKELEGGRFSLKYAGQVTGQIHGYGVYASAQRGTGEYYRSRIDNGFTVKGENITDLYRRLERNEEYEKLAIIEDLMFGKDVEALYEGTEEKVWFDKEIKPYLKSEGKLYELDVPEDYELIDEQKRFSEQPEDVQEVLLKASKESKGFGLLEKAIANDEYGGVLYDALGDDVFYEAKGYEGGSTETRVTASEYLDKQGIKGITYDGGNEGKNFVIFNPDNVKVLEKFYSQTEGDILGSYDIAKREVELFKGHNPSTLTHELGHHFIISHLNFMESIGANDKNKPVFEFLSGLANREINSVIDMKRADHENLIEAFIDYMNIGQAPNIVTGNIFQRAKNWLINEYNIHKTKASKEIREYFDTLISREGAIPDVSKIQDRIGEFKEILRQAQKGEQVSFNGMGIKEVKDLKKAINTKIRRKGLSLRDELIEAGGIKEGTELAKSLGFDVLKKDKMFTTKEHAIQTEDELIDWLAEKGYITPVQEGESYSDTEARWSEVENLIYDAERVYRPEEQRLNEEREASLVNQAKAQEIVDDILKDNKLGLKGVNDLYDLLQKISSRKDDVDIIKINKGAIKYLETRLNDLQRDYNDIIKQKDIEARKIGEELVKVNEERRNLKEEKKVSKKIRELAQKQYLEFVRNQHLSVDYKVKILNKVKDINSFSDLVRVVRQATPQIQRIIEMEMKHLQKRNIDIVLKRSKPKKRTQQISTYTYNKLFEELRAINKMTKENATVVLNGIRNKLGEMDKNGEIAEPTFAEIIRNKMLSYKSLGMDSSVELMNDLHNELLSLYAEAVNAGIDAKIEKFERRQNAINEVVDYIDTHEASKNFISRLLGKSKKSDDLYIKNTNFYGITNALFGKKWADKNEMVTVLNKVNIDTYKRREKAYKEAEKIYKVKDRGDLNTLLAQKENTDDYILRGNDGSVDEISIMGIMDLYLGMKNEQTRRQLLKNYEEFDEDGTQITTQIDDLIENLTDEDIEFANYLIKDLDKNYKELNKLYIKMYGIDMPKVENYFPRKSDRQDYFYDMERAKYIVPASAVASQMKDRASGVKPIVKSALSKYLENISDYYYMVDAFEKFKDIYDVVSSKQVLGAIKGKYSNGVTMALVDSIRAMSLRGQQVHLLSDIENSANRWVSNIIGSKIALNTSVFIKQLISITNYSENMPVKDFSKNLIEGLLNLRETVEFMNKFDGDFFETRMNAGLQSEAVARMIKEGEDLKNIWISAGDKYKWTKLMGSFVKWGDIIPIYIGGYARVKYLLDNGATLEEARQKFELETLQSQQDANAASLAKYQRNKNPASRLFSAFLNAPAQYMRKMYDADIQYRRKEITAEQFRKIVLNYGVIQPALYIMVSNMLKGLWDGDDDEAKFYHGLATQIVTSPFQGIPIAGSLLQNAGYFLEKKYRGESTNYGVIGVLFIDDVNRSYRKMGKKNKDIVDWIDIVSPFIEPFVIAPTNLIKQVTKVVETIID